MTLRSNDPCHCGSGKKYRLCCLNKDYDQQSPEQSGSVSVVMEWLHRNHRKAMNVALKNRLQEMLSEDAIEQLHELDEAQVAGICINLNEWLLAEGHLLIKGKERRISEYVLGINGPPLKPVQRQWIMQLENNPLRLYDVTDVVPGQQFTVCDVVDLHRNPIVVQERLGTQSLRPGMRLGCRLMRVGTHFAMSGAVYPFSLLAGEAAVERLKGITEKLASEQDLAHEIGKEIMTMWLEQFVMPAKMPTMTDAYSEDPIHLVTDLYHVDDWAMLERALVACKDVQGDRTNGWSRLLSCADGQLRPTVTVSVGNAPHTAELFSKTLAYASQGRAWFETLASSNVRFLHRDELDPAQGSQVSRTDDGEPVERPPLDVAPAVLTQAIEQALRRAYANWADEPVPMLDNQTPRQAMQTPAGLERVKGLIRSYETDEKRQAARQMRPAVSYAFLWASVGLTA